MKRFFAVLLVICFPSFAWASPSTRAAMITEITALLPSGTQNLTAANLRLVLTDLLAGVTAFIGDNPAVFPLPIRLTGSSSGQAVITAQAVAGTPTLTLPNASGTFAVNASSPLVLSATTGVLTCPTCSATTGTVTSVATGTGLSGGPITSTGTVSLASTAVSASTYGDATHVGRFTVDAQGRLTAASSVAITAGGTVTSVAAGTGLSASPSPVVGAGTLSLANTAVTPTTYGDATHIPQFTVDAQGRLTAASNVVATGTVSSITGGTGLTGGAITTSGTVAVDVATNSNMWAGTASKIPDAHVLHTEQSPTSLTISTSTFTPDFSLGDNFIITLIHASCPCTIANPTNGWAGSRTKFTIIQSPTGSDLVSWDSQYKFAGGTPPTLSTGANKVDDMEIYAHSTSFYAVSGLVADVR